MTWERVKEATQSSRESATSTLANLLGKAEETSGLKLRETLGVKSPTKPALAQAVEERTKEVVNAVEEELADTKVAVEEKEQEKVEEVKRLV